MVSVSVMARECYFKIQFFLSVVSGEKIRRANFDEVDVSKENAQKRNDDLEWHHPLAQQQ